LKVIAMANTRLAARAFATILIVPLLRFHRTLKSSIARVALVAMLVIGIWNYAPWAQNADLTNPYDELGESIWCLSDEERQDLAMLYGQVELAGWRKDDAVALREKASLALDEAYRKVLMTSGLSHPTPADVKANAAAEMGLKIAKAKKSQIETIYDRAVADYAKSLDAYRAALNAAEKKAAACKAFVPSGVWKSSKEDSKKEKPPGKDGPVAKLVEKPDDFPTKVEPPKLPTGEVFGPKPDDFPTKVEPPKLPTGEVFGPKPDDFPTKVEPPKLPTGEAFGPKPDDFPTKVEPPKLPTGEAFGPKPEPKTEPKTTLGPTNPLGGSAAGWVRVRDKDGKWHWILPTGSNMVSVDPPKGAVGPVAPLGGSAAGWQPFQGEDGKNYWIKPQEATLLPAEAPPSDPKQAHGPTTPLGGSAAGWVRVRDKDGKWHWILPTGSNMVSVDPPKGAVGPVAPLGGSAAGWQPFQGEDGKNYWIKPQEATMLPAEAPPSDAKQAHGPSTPAKKGKSAQKKQKGQQSKEQTGPSGSDVSNIIGTGVAIGSSLRDGRGPGTTHKSHSTKGPKRHVSKPSKATTGTSATTRKQPSAAKGASRATSGKRPGTTLDTTIGKPVIRGFGF
jgi:hypothetical protein